MDDPRDIRKPKTPPPHVRAQTAVPEPIEREQVTGRYDTFAEEAAARARRDVHETLLKGNRAISIKIAAGNRVFRDQMRELVAASKASTEERERRAAREERDRERLETTKRYLIRYGAPILTAIGGIITAWSLL